MRQDDQHKSDPYYLPVSSEIAQRKIGYLSAGGLGVGFIAAGLTGFLPFLVGGVLAGVYADHKRIARKIDDMRFLRETDCTGIFITNHHDFQAYRKYVGDEELIEQFKEADRHEMQISTPMYKFMQEVAPELLEEGDRPPFFALGQFVSSLRNKSPKPKSVLPELPKPRAIDVPATQSVAPAMEDEEGVEDTIDLPPESLLRTKVVITDLKSLLQECDRAGFPVVKILRHPLVWLHAPSQSGKSTFAYFLQGLRYLAGYQIGSASADIKDYKALKRLPWSDLAFGIEDFSQLVSNTAKKVEEADKGELKLSIVLDEINLAAKKGVSWQDLLEMVIIKGDKSGSGLIVCNHSDTLGTLKLTGIHRSLSASRAYIQLGRSVKVAGQTVEEIGQYTPNGKIGVTMAGVFEEWTIPSWMTPDPFTWLTTQFPELTQQPKQAQQPAQQKRSPIPEPEPPIDDDKPIGLLTKMRRMVRADDADFDVDSLSPPYREIAAFSLHRLGWVTASQCCQSITILKKGNYSTTQVRSLFQDMANRGWGVVKGEGDRLAYSAYKDNAER